MARRTIRKTIRKTAAPACDDVEKALLQRALGCRQQEIHAEDLIDKKSGEVLEVTRRRTVTKEVPPDVRALLFWLKNRAPERWRDRVESAAVQYEFDAEEAEL